MSDAQKLIQEILIDDLCWTLGERDRIEIEILMQEYAKAEIEKLYKELKLVDFYNVVLEASKLGGSLFPVLAVALSLNIILIEHRVPQGMVAVMQGYIDSPLAFMLLVNILLLIVGCLMGMDVRICGPKKLWPADEFMNIARGLEKKYGAKLAITDEIGRAHV